MIERIFCKGPPVRRSATEWTEEEDDELWRLFNQGISRLRLSVRLRRTDRAIQSRLTLLRKKHSQPPLAEQHQQRASH